ncbi:hypothetical protein ElyMa_003087500 [Elysia marginata]|uniref:Uncharacterized protein n=1 Tax=Elysia marginata TaxID=1093978 RepID=A0AAV4ISI8_9GAST|nr:hypothetical protein ElyMa_003087500 [Elysia marginata]
MPPTKQRSSKIRKSSKTALRQKMASITAKRLSSNPSNVPSPASNQTPESAQPATHADLPATQAETAASWSASKRKLSLFHPISAPTAELPTTVTDLSLIYELYKVALSPQCKRPSLQLCHHKLRDRGYAVFLLLKCSLCEDTLGETYTSKQTKSDQSMDTN